MPLPPAQLVDDLVEEVLLRFPPKDPATLVRAALVCKRWRRLVSGPGFRRRFSEFHRTAPMLGMLCNRETDRVSDFVPTTAFRPHHAERGLVAVDARHGRVLFRGEDWTFVVWDPITVMEWKVPSPPIYKGVLSWTAAAVLCSAAGAGSCDHLDCDRRHFIVVLAASVLAGPDAAVTSIYTYSSNAAAWSEPICGQRPSYFASPWIRSALVGNTLYFGNQQLGSNIALKYDMQLRQMSWIQLPSSFPRRQVSALTTTEDGGLRFAVEDEHKLYIWSTKDADEVDARWEQNRVIELNTLLPNGSNVISLHVVGSTDGLGTIFVSVFDHHTAYAIDLKTCKVKKVYEGAVYTIVPYMSFYTPVALETDGTGEGPSACGSSA